MSLLGKSLISLISSHTPFRVPCRYRRGIMRNIVDSFENEAAYKEHLEDQKSRKKAHKKTEERPKVKETKTKEDVAKDDEFDFYSDIPRDILNLKFTKPIPASVGSFARMMLNMKSRSYRDRHGTCLLEGKYLISDAMKAGLFIRLLYFSRQQNLVGLPVDILKKTNLVKIGFDEIRQASEVKVQSEGLLAVATKQDDITRQKLIKQRQEVLESRKESLLPVTLICDNIRDAGNLGSLLRAAAATGCEEVITTKGCVDIWDSKVIRAGAGAHFKIPIVPSLDWEDIQSRLGQYDIKDVFISYPRTGEIHVSDMMPNIVSKNTLHRDLVSNLEIEQTGIDGVEDLGNTILCSQPYYDATFVNGGHTVIILGSEVHGVSAQSHLFALEKSIQNNPGAKKHYNLVNIPMFTGTDCINTAMAGGILLFEARRQMLEN